MATGALDLRTIQKMNKEEQFRERIQKIKYTIFLLILFSLIIFMAIAVLAVLNEGLSAFVGSLLKVNLLYLGLALLSVFASYVIRFPKWHIYLNKLKVKLNLKTSFIIYMSMYSMDITPGRWGRAVVSFTINRITGAKFGRTFPAVVADNFTDFVGFAIVAIVVVFFVNKYVGLSVLLIVLMLIPFIFLYMEKPFKYLKSKLDWVKQLNSFFAVGQMYFRRKRMLDRKSYIYSLIVTVPSVVLLGLALYFVILGFGVKLSIAYLPTVIFVYCFATILGMVTGVPGTLGITDAALLTYLTALLPIDFGLVAGITIVFRIVTIWFVELMGFGSLAFTFKYWK
jgi:uncharacterized protein (TIRG00374 family)